MTTVIRNASDSYVSEKYPNRRYPGATRLYLEAGTSQNNRYGFIYFGIPSGMTGTNVQQATVRLFTGNGWDGSVTLTLQRLAEKFSVNRVTWNNKPGVTGTADSTTKSDAPRGTVWEFDVTREMQQVANGAPWYGFRITATNGNVKWLYSANGPDRYRPELEITWSDAPDQPERLIPDDGRAVSVAKPTLQWDYVDPSGDTTLQAANIRLFSTEALADANTPDLLDINVPLTEPQFDLNDPLAAAYTGLADGGTVWWRVQNIDGAGLLSAWSDPASFSRLSKAVVDITNPAAPVAPDPAFVSESTPPFSWTVTGRVQEKFEVLLTTPETPARYLWRSGIITSTETDMTPPGGKITEVGKTYRVLVRVYDTEDRVNVPDDPIYVEVSRDFVFDLDPTIDPVTGLTGDPHTYLSRITLEWDRSTAPDYFVVLRDNKEVAELEPSDVLVSGTHYQYRDDDARPRHEHTWRVAAKVNGKTSSNNPGYTGIVKQITTSISEVDGDRRVFLFDPQVEAAKAETSEIHYILGEAPPILITQSIRGYEGEVSGVLLDDTVPGYTADGQLDDLLWMKENPGMVFRLNWLDKSLRIVIRNVNDTPIARPSGKVEYLASFEFFEVGF